VSSPRRDRPPLSAVTPGRARLGECPVWCGRSRRLYWVDIDGRTVHRTDPERGIDEERELDVRPGSIALCRRDGDLLVAAEHGLHLLEWATGTLTHLRVLETADAPTRMNDGRCDPAGRFWVGSMDDPAGSGAHWAQLHRVEGDLTATTCEHGIGVSNSLAFGPDGTTMYWADTRQGVIRAYDYDVTDGSRSNERVLVDFAGQLPGAPDGACVDAAGCLWSACVYGWGLARITPHGEIDRFVELPVEKPSMPAFGGERLDMMFVTSISTGGSRPAAPGQPLAGALLAVDVGCVGLPEPRFAG